VNKISGSHGDEYQEDVVAVLGSGEFIYDQRKGRKG
jgi:hypothetical protein